MNADKKKSKKSGADRSGAREASISSCKNQFRRLVPLLRCHGLTACGTLKPFTKRLNSSRESSEQSPRFKSNKSPAPHGPSRKLLSSTACSEALPAMESGRKGS